MAPLQRSCAQEDAMKRRLAWVSVLVMLAACADLAGPDAPDPWLDFAVWRPYGDPTVSVD
jgi:hypothetical protein